MVAAGTAHHLPPKPPPRADEARGQELRERPSSRALPLVCSHSQRCPGAQQRYRQTSLLQGPCLAKRCRKHLLPPPASLQMPRSRGRLLPGMRTRPSARLCRSRCQRKKAPRASPAAEAATQSCSHACRGFASPSRPRPLPRHHRHCCWRQLRSPRNHRRWHPPRPAAGRRLRRPPPHRASHASRRCPSPRSRCPSPRRRSRSRRRARPRPRLGCRLQHHALQRQSDPWAARRARMPPWARSGHCAPG